MNKGLFLCGLFIALFLAGSGGGLRDGFHIGEGLHGL